MQKRAKTLPKHHKPTSQALVPVKKSVTRAKNLNPALKGTLEWLIFELVKDGHSYEEIPEKLKRLYPDLTVEKVSELVRASLKNMRANMALDADLLRDLESRRLDDVHKVAASIMKGKGKAPIKLMAAKTVIDVSKERRNLHGLSVNNNQDNGEKGVRVYVGINMEDL